MLIKDIIVILNSRIKLSDKEKNINTNKNNRESWGYKKDEDYYSLRHLIKSIDKYLSVGAAYLLNVGPKADGTIDSTSRKILQKIGQWHDSVKESFVDVDFAKDLVEDDTVLITKRGNTIYIHLILNQN